MIFANGAPCRTMAADSPQGTERYCLGSKADFNLRGWAIPVDLDQAKPVVRNPALEVHGGLAHKLLPNKVKDVRYRQYASPRGPYGGALCRYIGYSPDQYLEHATGGLADRAKVVINTNFFLFVDVREMPCGTPIGPVVADGQTVQNWANTVKDLKTVDQFSQFQIVKTTHVLVMYMGMGAFIIKSKEFDQWFEGLTTEQRSRVNAVTGHRILKDGAPVDQRREFKKADEERFWTGKNARSVIGVQYSGACSPPVPTTLKCGKMLLVLQFEKSSQGRSVSTFFSNASMSRSDRPQSSGVTVPEVQEILQFMMVDDALNFDGSGSSSLWTSIGNLAEKRSQPSDVVDAYGDAYQFRPSPIHLAFE